MKFLLKVAQTFSYPLSAQKFINANNSYYVNYRNQNLVVAFLFALILFNT